MAVNPSAFDLHRSPHGARRYRTALGLMATSGCAGLGYLIVWSQQCALWLGYEAAALFAVITAVLGGFALGSLAFAGRIQRSAQPERWFAGLQTLIALWSVALALLLAPVSGLLLAVAGPEPAPAWQWTVVFAGTSLLLLPATAAMGATLPAMERVLARLDFERHGVAALYAACTLGAFAGVVASAFWLVPQIGLMRTATVCAALNVACAVGALRLRSDAPFLPELVRRPAQRGMLWTLAATGLLGLGYAVLVVRVLSQVAQNTVYTFALWLAVCLAGTALGAAAWQRWLAERAHAPATTARLLQLQAATCLLGGTTLWGAEYLKTLVLQALGPGMGPALAAEATLAVAAFVPATLVMGALFSHLALQARAAHHPLGFAFGCHVLGAAAAPLLFGALLAPVLGAKFALLLLAAGYLFLALPRPPLIPAFVLGTTLVAMAAWVPALHFLSVPRGGRVVSFHEGTMATVNVIEDAEGVARLHVNNGPQEGSNATQFGDVRQALLPLLLHAAPKRALFLGLGTGVAAHAAALDPALHVDAVELLPEVIAASRRFTRPFAGQAATRQPRFVAADVRRFVKAGAQRYDVIVADDFHPARSGAGALYTVEHFKAMRVRLAEGGVLCQWLPLHHLDPDTLRSIVRAFFAVNPGGWAMLATHDLQTPVLGLVARADAKRFDLRQLRARMAAAANLPKPPADFGIVDELALLGGFVAGREALLRFAGDAPLNTDDLPVVAYSAPRLTYAPDSLPRERLLDLLRQLRVAPAEVIDADDTAWRQRLAAYWTARNQYLAAGRNVTPSADASRLLAQVREPLLSVLRVSPEFRPAYDPLLRLADALAHTDPLAARALLAELHQLQPARPEAEQALRSLGPAAL